MVCKSNYTGSTEQEVSDLTAPSISSNRYQELPDHSSSSSQEEPLLEPGEAVDSWVNSHTNFDEVKGSPVVPRQGLFDDNSSVALTQQVDNDSDVPKVLVVDDHPPSRMTAAALLAMENYQVIEADSGYSAIALIAQKQPDLILLDVMMPGMDGFEVCQKIKQDEQTRLIPIIFITALNDKRSRIRGIEVGGDDFLTKPFDRLELSARVKSLVRQKRLNEDLDHAEKVLFSIARTIESRDPNTGNHCERLVSLGKAFGEYLHLPRNQIRDLMWGGYLHDIGKVGIPDSVLLKQGRLTAEEWQTMQQHVKIGEQICQPLRTMRGVIPIIRHHHERWDGSGYPDSLKGDEIPYLAQIFQIIDIYDALTSERTYKPAFTPEKAITMMLEETKKGWRNPKLMQQFQTFILGKNTANHLEEQEAGKSRKF